VSNPQWHIKGALKVTFYVFIAYFCVVKLRKVISLCKFDVLVALFQFHCGFFALVCVPQTNPPCTSNLLKKLLLLVLSYKNTSKAAFQIKFDLLTEFLQ
jgi:hypothetical protein